MSAFEGIQSFLDKHLAPFAVKLSSNEILKSISGGLIATMPITLGVSLISIVINLPIPGWTDFLASSGLSAVANQVLAVTMNMLSPYIVVALSYRFGKLRGLSGMTSAILSLGAFLILMPLTVETADYSSTYFLNMTYLGSGGIFVALIVGLAVPAVLSVLMKRVSLKLPDTVPPMVSDSLNPTFAAMILFVLCLLLKWGMMFTPWGNLFDMISGVVAAPIMNVGTSPIALILVQTFSMFLWFFGIHPSAITNVYMPVLMACNMGNMEAALAGQSLPYFEWAIVCGIIISGGTAEGIGLAVSSLFAKSERFKALSRISFVPALFNITEPLMFGLPAVLNPVFFIPMVLVKPLCGLVTLGLTQLGLANAFNPLISMPWITPTFITTFLQGGFGYLAIALINIVLAVALFFPFFKVADRAALAEERAAQAE